MPKKTPQTATRAVRTSQPAKSLRPQQPKTSSLPRPKRPLPATSVAKTKKAFKSFSLSKFADNALPSHYVAAGHSPAEAQRQRISQHLDLLSKSGAPPRTLAIALPEASIKQSLPSFNAKAGTIDVHDVISFIQRNMRGTEFYANGNPTLNRLAIQSQVKHIIDSIKQD